MWLMYRADAPVNDVAIFPWTINHNAAQLTRQ